MTTVQIDHKTWLRQIALPQLRELEAAAPDRKVGEYIRMAIARSERILADKVKP